MINLPSDWNTVVPAGQTKRVKPGGYVGKVVNARFENTTYGDKLTYALDITEGEFKNFYQSRYNEKKQNDANAAWPCKYSCFLTTKDGKTSRTFKGSVVAVEKSTPGYSFTGDEKTLVGKPVGIVFGEEEFLSSNGNIATAVKPRYLCSVDSIRNGEYEIPQKKTLAPSSNDFLSSLAAAGKLEVVEDFSDELPF